MQQRETSPEKIRFSYATPEQPLVQRSFIRAVETLGGQRRLANLYDRFARAPGLHGDFYDAAIELMQLDVRYESEQLAKVPATGPVLFVANHPYGVIDGLVFIWLARQVRPDITVLTNKVLCQASEARSHLLPIDFSGTPEALKTNINSRRQALSQLREGGAVGVFPAGAVSASAEPWRGPAVDVAWQPFIAKLLMRSKATVVPVYFAGQNSRMFQLASHVSYTWRLSLYFWETARRIGSRFDVAIGDPIPYEEFEGHGDKTELLLELRRRTYELAGRLGIQAEELHQYDREYIFPNHFNL